MKVQNYSEYMVILERKKKNALRDFNKDGDTERYQFTMDNIAKALAELQK